MWVDRRVRVDMSGWVGRSVCVCVGRSVSGCVVLPSGGAGGGGGGGCGAVIPLGAGVSRQIWGRGGQEQGRGGAGGGE